MNNMEKEQIYSHIESDQHKATFIPKILTRVQLTVKSRENYGAEHFGFLLEGAKERKKISY